MIFHWLEKNHGGKIMGHELRCNKMTSIAHVLGGRGKRISRFEPSGLDSFLGPHSFERLRRLDSSDNQL